MPPGKKSLLRFRRRRPKKSKAKKSVDSKQNKEIKKLKKDVKNLKGLDETKFLDHVSVTTMLNSTTGDFFDMNPLGVWDSSSATANADRQGQREGNKVTSSSIQVQGTVGFNFDLLTGDRQVNPTRVRILLIQFKEEDPTNPVALNVKDFLQNPNSGTSTALSWVDALYNLNRTKDMKILSDKKYTLEESYYNYANPTTSPTTTVQFSGFTTTHPSQINVSTKVYGSKMYSKGVIHWKQGSTNVNPYKGRVVMFAVCDRENLINLIQTKRHIFKDAV